MAADSTGYFGIWKGIGGGYCIVAPTIGMTIPVAVRQRFVAYRFQRPVPHIIPLTLTPELLSYIRRAITRRVRRG